MHERESPCLPRGCLGRSKSGCVWFGLAKPVTGRSNGRFAAATLQGSVTGRSDLRLKGSSMATRTSIIPTWSCVAPQTAKMHTPITLGIRIRTKLLVLKSRKHRPRGFDSHRPLHFSLSGVLLRCLRTRLSSSSSSHSLDAATVHLIECVDRLLGRARSRWPHPSVIDPLPALATVGFPAMDS
jgi:hypothetical protein